MGRGLLWRTLSVITPGILPNLYALAPSQCSKILRNFTYLLAIDFHSFLEIGPGDIEPPITFALHADRRRLSPHSMQDQ